MMFPPVAPPDAAAAAAARARQDTLTKPRGRAGPPRGPVGLGLRRVKDIAHQGNSSAPGWWCSPATTASPGPGCRPTRPR